jgi:Mg/Co/Ni transporter MgtE
MSNEIATTDRAGVPALDSFDTSLAAERDAEKTVMRSVVRTVAIGVPLGIAFFIALLGIAVGDQLEWWAIIGLGVGLGLVAAILFGMLAGVTLAAHAFEDVDRGAGHEPAH